MHREVRLLRRRRAQLDGAQRIPNDEPAMLQSGHLVQQAPA